MGELKVLIRSYPDSNQDQEKNGIPYCRMEFHLVDLKTNKVDLCFFPSLFFDMPDGSMVTSGSALYIFGGPPKDSPSGQPEDLFMGGACLDWGSGLGLRWSQVPLPIAEPMLDYCASLNEKIYGFGLSICPEVFDPVVGHWTPFSVPLPSHLAGSLASMYVLSDSTNNRLIMHLSGGGLPEPSLYAFYPNANNGCPWQCLAPGFQEWYHISTVDDGVLYLHDRKKYRSSILGAYDLEKRMWLNVEWTTRFEDVVDKSVAHREFDAVFPLGPKTLCLVHWTPETLLYPDLSPDSCRFLFLKFQVKRKGSTLHLVPLSSHVFDLPNTVQVHSFIGI